VSILTLAAFGVSPGVSTTAVAMTLQWPRPVLLVEADVSKPSSVLAGWLQGSMPADSGLMGIAHNSMRQALTEQDIWDYAVDLGTGQDVGQPSRWLLPAMSEPLAARSMRGLWPELMMALRAVSGQDIDVIVDAGRSENAHGREALWRDSDHLSVVVRSDLVSVAAARAYLPAVLEARATAGAVDTSSLLVVEDRAQEFPSKDISKVLGLPVRGRLPQSPEAGAHFGGGAQARSWRLRSYTRAIGAANASLADALMARRQLIEADMPTETGGEQR